MCLRMNVKFFLHLINYDIQSGPGTGSTVALHSTQLGSIQYIIYTLSWFVVCEIRDVEATRQAAL